MPTPSCQGVTAPTEIKIKTLSKASGTKKPDAFLFMSSVHSELFSSISMLIEDTPQMVSDREYFNEAWTTVHAINPEWESDKVMAFLLKQYFNKRYHKFTKLNQFLNVGSPGSTFLCSTVVCGRCDINIGAEVYSANNVEWKHYNVGVVKSIEADSIWSPYLSFGISKGFLEDVTINRENIPYCPKLASFL